MRAVADYIGVLALTRLVSLDTCSGLPSIVDLFSSACPSRAKPGSITTADAAFLTALYASDLEQNLNTERADMHDHMMAYLGGR